MRKLEFVEGDINLGSLGSEVSKFVGISHGDPSVRTQEVLTSDPEDDGSFLRYSFDYQEYLKVGFEVDFFATLGNVDVVAPVFVDLDYASLERQGRDFIVDTSDWSWGDTIVLASGPQYSLGAELVAEFLFVTTNEKLEVFGNSNPFPANTILPDFYAIGSGGTSYNPGAFRQELFDLDSTQELSKSFEIGLSDFTASIPASLGAVTNNDLDDDDNLVGGVTIADSVSDPFFQGGFDLDSLLKATNSAPFTALAAVLDGEFDVGPSGSQLINTLRGDFLSDEGWEFDYTILDFNVVFGLNLTTEYIFTPNEIQVELTNLTTGLSVSGVLGDTLDYGELTVAGSNDFQMSYTLSGSVQARYGIAASLAFPFTSLALSLESDEGNSIVLSDGLTEQLPNPAWVSEPIALFETDPINVSLGTFTDLFSVEVLPSADPANPSPDPILPSEVSVPFVDTIADATVTEGGDLSFAVTLSEIASSAVTVYFSVNRTTAESDDLTQTFGQITIGAGQQAGSIELATTDDADFDDEAISVLLYAADGAVLSSPLTADGLIFDNDTPPAFEGETPVPGVDPELPFRPTLINVSNDTVDAGDELRFDLTFDQSTTEDVIITYRIVRLTAERSDIGGVSGKAVLQAGASSLSVDLATFIDEDLDDETVELRVIALDGADFGADRAGSGIILDVFAPSPTPANIVSFTDVSTTEGSDLVFEVVLNKPTPVDVNISFEIEFLTAENADYAPLGDLSLTIEQGESSGQISLGTNFDNDSRDETLNLKITSASGVGSIADTVALGTIFDPDQALLPEIVAGEITITEGNSQSIPIQLAYNPQNKTVTADYSLISGSAIAGTDFVAASGSITLVSDDNPILLNLQTIDDGLVEGTEDLYLEFTNIVGGEPDIAPFKLSIDDNDSADGSFGFAFQSQSGSTVGPVVEGQQIHFDLLGVQYANGPSALSADITLNYEIEGLDTSDVVSVTSNFVDGSGNIQSVTYNGLSGSLPVNPFYFAQSNSTQFYYVSVQLADDTIYTGDRDGFLRATPGFSNGQTITIDPFFSQRANFTIQDNDPLPPPLVSLATTGVREGENTEIAVQLEYARSETLTFTYEITSSTENPAAYFAQTTGTITVPASHTSAAIVLSTFDDAVVEDDTTFTIALTGVVLGAADISGAVANLVLIDDDLPGFTSGADILVLSGDEPDDDFFALAGNDRITGSNRSELIDGGADDDTLDGKDGNDSLLGQSGADILIGGFGNDELIGGGGQDKLRGGAGKDNIDGGNEADIGFGGDGDDLMDGGDGDDQMSGGDGDDMIYGGLGADLLKGEKGNDDLFGQDGNDILRGGDGDDVLRGGDGDDEIQGSNGADELYGDAGDDILIGDGQSDLIYGGDGTDTLRGGGGNDILNGDAGNDVMFGSSGEDILNGGAGDDTLEGNAQSDQLFGNAGNDILRGGDGFDDLFGGDGNDILVGGDGNDLLVGGLGVDTLRGNANSDTFRFLDHAASTHANSDLIDGIEGVGVTGGDRIDVASMDADLSTAVDDAFVFLGEATLATAVAHGAGALWVQNVGHQTRLYGLVDGDATIDFLVRINDGNGIVASDYVVQDFLL